ncbi:MAG: hypothetical protein SGILL_002118, partial [Bacillariaceae sp.]
MTRSILLLPLLMLLSVVVMFLRDDVFPAADAFLSPPSCQSRTTTSHHHLLHHVIPATTLPNSKTVHRRQRRQNTSLGIQKRSLSDEFGGDLDTEDALVILAPAILTILAFEFYDETNLAFHKLVEFASSNSWQAVDGGAYLSDLLIPALNGPIVTFISLLFGSLSSMTLSNLLTRQIALATNFAKFVEDVRLLDLHLCYLPTDYQLKSKLSLRKYAAEMRKIFNVGEQGPEAQQAARELRREEIEYLMSLLHDLSSDSSAEVSDRVMDEAYGTLNRIIDRRSDMLTVYDQ